MERYLTCHDCGSKSNETAFPRRRSRADLALCEDCIMERGRTAYREEAVESRRKFLETATFARRARQAELQF
jgi:hypothetical protein